MATADLKNFIDWFSSHGGAIDFSSIDFTVFPVSEGGRGVIAVRDIPQGQTLFSIPRSITLSTRTSELPSIFGLVAWKNFKLHEGWAGLILCMLWEQAQGASSKWSDYLTTLPTQFETPMFWNEAELDELRGTSVVEKIGRAEAERDYYEKMIPAIQTRPDLFPPTNIAVNYSLGLYHIMGSRILSRSFTVEPWEADDDDTGPDEGYNTSFNTEMEVDPPSSEADPPERDAIEGGNHSDITDDEDLDDSSDIAMVPMADILNARFECENAKLFYGKNDLTVVSTKPIKVGEQIWNTYGDLPNTELLRRYGHVDLLPLPGGGEGNPGDVVEVRADLLASAVQDRHPDLTSESLKERIDWWLEEGGDDTFVIEYDSELPSAMISLARLFLLPSDEWSKTRQKSKLPRPKVDRDVQILAVDTLERRMKEYPTTLQDDEKILQSQVSLHKRFAVIARIGEKKILTGMLDDVKAILNRLVNQSPGMATKKRKGAHDDSEMTKVKKSKR